MIQTTTNHLRFAVNPESEVEMDVEKEILITVREPGPDGDEASGKLISQETLTTSDGLEAVEKMLASLRVKLLRRLGISTENTVASITTNGSRQRAVSRTRSISEGLSSLQAAVVTAMKKHGLPVRDYKALYPFIEEGVDAGTPDDTTKLRNVIQVLKTKGFVTTNASGARELTLKGQTFSS
jgi:ribosomal protein S19E (S16A)